MERADDTSTSPAARAACHALMARLLCAAPSDGLRTALAAVPPPPGEGALSIAAAALFEAARHHAPAAIERQYEALFVAVGDPPFDPRIAAYGRGQDIVAWRALRRQCGLAHGDNAIVPDDHVACLFDAMALLVRREEAALQHLLLRLHLLPWGGVACDELARLAASDDDRSGGFYGCVARFGEALLDAEAERAGIAYRDDAPARHAA